MSDDSNDERRLQAELRVRIDNLATPHAPVRGPFPYSVPAPGAVAEPNMPNMPNMPVRNLVSVLPKIAYKEQHEEEFERSLEYVGIQRKILRALEKQDTILTAREAYTWTKDSVVGGKRRSPILALRLCYYMRSLGYDTFASIKTAFDPINQVKTAMLRLFIANPDSEMRGEGHDYLYWMQDTHSGAIYPKAYKLRLLANPPVDARRDAPAHALHLGPSFNAQAVYQQFLQHQQQQQQQREPPHIRGGEAQPFNPPHLNEHRELWHRMYDANRALLTVGRNDMGSLNDTLSRSVQETIARLLETD